MLCVLPLRRCPLFRLPVERLGQKGFPAEGRFRSKKFTHYYPVLGCEFTMPCATASMHKGSGMNIMNLLCFSEW